MGRAVERQRSDLIHVLERILASSDIESAHELARCGIDSCAILKAAGERGNDSPRSLTTERI
jgi:hypothetical protein